MNASNEGEQENMGEISHCGVACIRTPGYGERHLGSGGGGTGGSHPDSPVVVAPPGCKRNFFRDYYSCFAGY